MTLEQLMSPKVTEWIDNYNHQINEGHVYSDEKLFEDFDKWFVQNEDAINKSIKSVNEGDGKAFAALFDDDEDDEVSDKEDSKSSPFTDMDDEPKETISDELDEPDEKEEEEEETISRDPRARIRVDNSSGRHRNVFKVVNMLYDKITDEKKNMDKLTYLKFLDTSEVTDMTALLAFTNLPNADLSSWDTSRVVHMEGMFYKSTFNNDSICNWNVSRCADFKNMFLGSKFNQSLSRWKPKMIKTREVVYDEETGERIGTEEVEKRAALPFVGAYEDEEKEMDAAFWDEKFKDGIKENRKSKYSHFMDFETFMINEGIWDKTKSYVKKGIDSVKNVFKSVAMKLQDWFITFVDEKGEPIPVVSPYTTLNYISSGKVDGVKAYSSVNNNLLNGVSDTPKLMEDRGYYNNISKDSVEYKNFETFVQMINESSNKGKFDELLNEARVDFSAAGGGLKGIRDIDSKKLKKYIRYQMMSTPGTMGKDALKPILIWGAPGVGKSTIPNVIINEYNETKTNSEEKKSLIVAECGDMTADGFALPMPNRMSMEEYIESRPKAKKWAKEAGISDDELKNSMVVRSSDAPKMWLPCYKPDPDKRINDLRKMIANGHVREYFDKDGNYQIEETCDGGLIMFDEFFRADPSIFKIVMQILLNRKYGGYVLGDKWGIIACSNRPNDDDEVSQSFEQTGAVVTTRFATQYNFIPDFLDWKKWAETDGHFDELTLSFITSEKDGKDEFINWHDIDPDLHTEGYVAHPTPRSWSALMNKLYNICKMEGYDNISEIPKDEFEDHVYGAIGELTGRKYVEWVYEKGDSILNIRKVFEDKSYVIPEPIPSAAEISEKIINYIDTNYSIEELPNVEYLINMYELLNKTYSKTKDNYIKQMHINILKKLVNNKDSARQLKEYYKLCCVRYDIKPEDLSN